MAPVSMNSVRYYQLPSSAGRPSKGRAATWNRGASTASKKHENPVAPAPNVSPSARLQDIDLIERIDLTTSLPGETRDLFGEPALNFGGPEKARGNIYRPQYRWAFNDDFQIPHRLGPFSWPMTRRTTTPYHPSRDYWVMLEKHRSHHMRYQSSTIATEGLTGPLNIPSQRTTTTLPLPERNEIK